MAGGQLTMSQSKSNSKYGQDQWHAVFDARKRIDIQNNHLSKCLVQILFQNLGFRTIKEL